MWPDLAGKLKAGRHVLPVRIYYEDTDFTGIVYHGAYVRFFERGRSDFLRLCGVHHNDLRSRGEQGLAFAVKSMSLDFQRPAKIDDLVEVHTSLIELRGARIALDQLIVRGDELLVAAKVIVAVITLDGRPTRLPDDLAEKLSSTFSGKT